MVEFSSQITRAVGLVLVAFILFMVVSTMFDSSGGGIASMNSMSSNEAYTTRALLKEAAQWSTISNQDSNPLLALMHSTYGMAYLNVARRLYTDSEIERTGNVRVDEFFTTLEASQQDAVQKLLTLCPISSPAGLASLHTGWLK